MKQAFYETLSNEPIAPAVYKLVLAGDTSPITAPGQFVNIKVPGFYLRRPISLCDWDDKALTVIYKVVGDGTKALSQVKKGEKLDLLITESAGLCGRCSPHIRDIPAVCVIDCLSGITAPQKIGPMLRYADFIAVTKGDLVSPAEREEFTQVFFDLLAASRAETLSELSQSWADSALAVAEAYAALPPAVRRDMLDYLWRFLVNMGTGGKG